VIVTFIGNPNLSSHASTTLDALAESFSQAYNAINRLNPNTWDQFFRFVQDATVIKEDGRKHQPRALLQHIFIRALDPPTPSQRKLLHLKTL
jgi:hypothetical protein